LGTSSFRLPPPIFLTLPLHPLCLLRSFFQKHLFVAGAQLSSQISCAFVPPGHLVCSGQLRGPFFFDIFGQARVGQVPFFLFMDRPVSSFFSKRLVRQPLDLRFISFLFFWASSPSLCPFFQTALPDSRQLLLIHASVRLFSFAVRPHFFILPTLPLIKAASFFFFPIFSKRLCCLPLLGSSPPRSLAFIFFFVAPTFPRPSFLVFPLSEQRASFFVFYLEESQLPLMFFHLFRYPLHWSLLDLVTVVTVTHWFLKFLLRVLRRGVSGCWPGFRCSSFLEGFLQGLRL